VEKTRSFQMMSTHVYHALDRSGSSKFDFDDENIGIDDVPAS
jgi:hypothetical protein